MSEETVCVPLTLEESGVLCHALLIELKRTGVLSGRPLHPMEQRMLALHQKLAAANDELMSRDTPAGEGLTLVIDEASDLTPEDWEQMSKGVEG